MTTLFAMFGLVACTGEITLVDGPEDVGVPRERPQEVVTQTDRVTQITEPTTDIIFSVDNSCSMGDDQDELRRNFPVFLEFFVGSGLDYHIGIVSTDVDDSGAGLLYEADGVRFLTPAFGEEEAQNIFGSMVQQLGTGGSITEKGMDAVFIALEEQENSDANRGFYRDDASLNVVFVSDEEDQSTKNSRDEWLRWFRGLKGDDDLISASSIVCYPPGRLHEGRPPGACTGTPGTNYLFVSDEVGGITWDITDQNWVEVLNRLGIQASGRKTEFFLSQAPVVDTIEVNVLRDTGLPQLTPIRPPGGFEIEYNAVRNSITFDNFIPKPLDIIEITYTLLSATQAVVDGDEEEPADTGM